MTRTRMTMAQALVRYLVAQRVEVDGGEVPLFAGVWAIFGHGNVAGLGHALAESREVLPVYRGQNEQSMTHAAIGFAKASRRRRMMACTTSIGPGATNLVTAAGVAHVNRLPVLLLPGDVFASRLPDPVLQQLEVFGDATLSVNDCLKPVSRFWDRITRPEQLMGSLPQAIRTLTDPADCGPVTLALPQDVQTEAFDFPDAFFAPRVHRPRRICPDADELRAAVQLIRSAQAPLLIAGGGVHYADATLTLAALVEQTSIPVAETQAGKGALVWDHPNQVGGMGVTGSSAANTLAAKADLVVAVGTRLSDFTTASRTVFASPEVRLVALNVASFDATKHGAQPLVADAREGLRALAAALQGWRVDSLWSSRVERLREEWHGAVASATTATEKVPPSDAQVLGVVNRACQPEDLVVCAAGGLPGELHKLWRVQTTGTYHLEYGYSCMGYEIAGGLGAKMARPEREVFVLVGDGSYLMLNSEILTAVALGRKLNIVLLDNHGFGCINRLQQSTGAAPFLNLFSEAKEASYPAVDFAAHAASLGARVQRVVSLAELEQALVEMRRSEQTSVVVIETDPHVASDVGGAWWDVAVPQISEHAPVQEARRQYETMKRRQKAGRP